MAVGAGLTGSRGSPHRNLGFTLCDPRGYRFPLRWVQWPGTSGGLAPGREPAAQFSAAGLGAGDGVRAWGSV